MPSWARLLATAALWACLAPWQPAQGAVGITRKDYALATAAYPTASDTPVATAVVPTVNCAYSAVWPCAAPNAQLTYVGYIWVPVFTPAEIFLGYSGKSMQLQLGASLYSAPVAGAREAGGALGSAAFSAGSVAVRSSAGRRMHRRPPGRPPA